MKYEFETNVNERRKEIRCPVCNKDLTYVFPIIHADGFGFCCNYIRCSCGHIIKEIGTVDNKTIITDELNKDDKEILKGVKYDQQTNKRRTK